MFRVIFFIGLVSLPLIAESIGFHETKFVKSLELYTYRDGNVSYENNSTKVAYKDGRTIVKGEDNVTVYDNKNEVLTVIPLTERPEIGLYFSLTKALFEKDFELLKELCEVVQTTSLCGLGQTAPNPILNTIQYFEDEYLAGIKKNGEDS